MKRFLNKISYICIAYTLSILCLIFLKVFSDDSIAVTGEESVVILAIIVAAHVVNWALGLISFHNKLACTAAGFFAQYAAFCCILLGWYKIHKVNDSLAWFLKSTGIYIVVYALITVYCNKKAALEAAEINRLLNQFGDGIKP